MLRNQKRKGFTLIELLVTVSLIGVLSGILLGVLNVQGLRKKARDSQRVADLKKIQTALEAYLADNREYPDTGSIWINTEADAADLKDILSPDYLSTFPADPSLNAESLINSGPCSNTDRFRYNYKSDGARYVLTAIMEVESSAEESLCHDLYAWTDYPASGTKFGCSNGSTSYGNNAVCYGVQSP